MTIIPTHSTYRNNIHVNVTKINIDAPLFNVSITNMNKKPAAKPLRSYQQKARAIMAEATSQRILEAFLKRVETQWFEEITLDVLAADAGVTVQTVVRKYGGKDGLIEAACQHLEKQVHIRRSTESGDIDRVTQALADDYEASGRLILHLLNQEDRHPALKPALNRGRRGHREWLASVFTPMLDPLPPARRTATLDALVVATDVYTWKLVRVDMERPVTAFKSIVKQMLLAALPRD